METRLPIMCNIQDDFKFERPPTAPTFRPTQEEFHDPIEYISKIRNLVERFGICKIIPPKEWQPPFCIDNDEFKFVPRLQRLNELEAKTRIKLDFIDDLSKFWSLQGTKLKIPMIEKRQLDFHEFHQIVSKHGGFERIQHTKKWIQVAQALKYTDSSTPKILKTTYEKMLYPYDVFKAGVMLQIIEKEPIASTQSNETLVSKKLSKSGKRGPSRAAKDVESIICLMCKRGDDESNILLCDDCDCGYHTYCLYPPLDKIPKGEWRCPKCVSKECNQKQVDAFGFEQSPSEFTLSEFGVMADKFKREYFKSKLTHGVSEIEIEREFWRLLSSVDANLTVQYGADLHSKDVGSGFPSIYSKPLKSTEYQTYLKSKWNLNNLTQNSNSVLSFLNVDISGMKIPWVYVGMCFSCFCWHVEDHWSYSINYLHFGEAKTWYGVSGAYAEKFEDVMRRNAPELFEKSPDLLHHLVTIMNPNILMKHGVPITRLDQRAGEFVVTFPRAYHAGFNQGFNCAEAVNFCPPDWMQIGRAAVENYKQIKRLSVFSHEELICNLAQQTHMNIDMAKVVEYELSSLVDYESTYRKVLLEKGITKSTREIFENLPDDERICDYCKGTCFVSAVYCSCSSSRLVCLNHYEYLCMCPVTHYTLKYRFTMDDLLMLLKKLKNHCEEYQQWNEQVKNLLYNQTDNLNEIINVLKQKLEYAHRQNYFKNDSLAKKLDKSLNYYEKYKFFIENFSLKIKSERDDRIEFNELKSVMIYLDKIPCFQNEIKKHESLFHQLNDFEVRLKELTKSSNLKEIKQLIDDASSLLVVKFVQLDALQYHYDQQVWLEKLNISLDNTSLTLDSLRQLISSAQKLRANETLNKSLEQLQDLLSIGDLFDKKVENILHDSQTYDLHELDVWLEKANLIPIKLSNVDLLGKIVNDAREWSIKVEKSLNSNEINVDELYVLKSASHTIPANLTIKLNDLNAKLNEIESIHREITSLFNSTSDVFCLLMPENSYRDQFNKLLDENPSLNSNFSRLMDQKDEEIIEILRRLNIKRFSQSIRSKLNKDLFKKCSLCYDYFVDNSNSITSRPVLCDFCNRFEAISIETLKNLLVKVAQSNINSRLTQAFKLYTQRCVNCQNQIKVLLELQICSHVNTLLNQFDLLNLDQDELFKNYEAIDENHRLMLENLYLQCLLLNFKCKESALLILLYNALERHRQEKLDKSSYPIRSRAKRKITPPANNASRLKKKSSSNLTAKSVKSLSAKITHELDEKCAKLNECKEPREDNITWVQCDGICNKWFHMICVGLPQINPNEQYVCDLCKIDD